MVEKQTFLNIFPKTFTSESFFWKYQDSNREKQKNPMGIAVVH